MLLSARNREKRLVSILQIIGRCWFILSGAAMAAMLPKRYVVNLIKIPWGRARMRLVAVDDRAYFMPWLQPGRSLRDMLVAAGVVVEEFKSIPSGHTANASSLMLLCLLPMLRQKIA